MKRQRLVALVILLCLPWLWIASRLGDSRDLYEVEENEAEGEFSGSQPLILLWTSLDGDFANWRRQFPGSRLQCGTQTCKVSSSHSHLANASAVVVSLADVLPWSWAWLPMQTPKDQIWVAKWSEAPWFYKARKFLDPRAGSLDNIFRWTVSYQSHSSFQSSMFEKPRDNCSWTLMRSPSLQSAQSSLPSMASKSELAVWIVSHCQTNSHREDYVQELQKYMPVSVLGKCGLGRDSSAWHQVHWAKFYLAFENSICDDYITEKFHFILANYNTVPVVLGPRKEDYEKVSPPKSFIHTADFPSPKALAQYLLHLDSHPEEYLGYLEWKRLYQVQCEETWSCKMCRKLHKIESGQMQTPQIIKDFSKVWDTSHCYSSWNHSERSLE